MLICFRVIEKYLTSVKMENPINQRKSEEEFVQLLTEKAHMLRKHLKDTHYSLIMCANIRPNISNFRLYNTLEKDSLKFQSIITNSENLGKQLYQLWLQLNSSMQKYCPPSTTV